MEHFHVIIAGTRGRIDPAFFREMVRNILKKIKEPVDLIIRDDGFEVDSLTRRFASDYGFDLVTFPADWKRDGNTAGLIRNRHMASAADYAILIWDGFSKDIRDLILQCKRFGVKFKVFIIEM